jgi:hypothetical protein
MPRVATGKPNGRPTKKNAQAIARILKIARTGLPLKFAAQAGNIDSDTLAQWRAKDPQFERALSQARLEAVEKRWEQIQKAAEDRLDADGKLVKAGDWKSLAWQLERAYPSEFARPEIALGIQQNNVSNDHLTIVISAEEARQLNAESEASRAKVREMFAKYRPALRRDGNGNGNGDGERTHDVEAEPVKKPEDLSPISGKGNTPEFWFQFASGSGERVVSKEVGIHVASTIVNETVGRGLGNQAVVAFKSEPVTVADVLAVIERLCGGPAGWQRLQRKAGLSK